MISDYFFLIQFKYKICNNIQVEGGGFLGILIISIPGGGHILFVEFFQSLSCLITITAFSSLSTMKL